MHRLCLSDSPGNTGLIHWSKRGSTENRLAGMRLYLVKRAVVKLGVVEKRKFTFLANPFDKQTRVCLMLRSGSSQKNARSYWLKLLNSHMGWWWSTQHKRWGVWGVWLQSPIWSALKDTDRGLSHLHTLPPHGQTAALQQVLLLCSTLGVGGWVWGGGAHV